jgi:hypothetical protein
VEKQFAGQILGIDRAVARTWPSMTAAAIGVGQPLRYADALIAATALAHGLTVVTCNERDFVPSGVSLVNPWQVERSGFSAEQVNLLSGSVPQQQIQPFPVRIVPIPGGVSLGKSGGATLALPSSPAAAD